MRPILIVAVAVLALSATDGAQAQSFFNKQFCLSPSDPSGVADCSYNTWEQCRASISGSEYCYINPFWKAEAPAKKERPQRR
jgi:hypothetical protein